MRITLVALLARLCHRAVSAQEACFGPAPPSWDTAPDWLKRDFLWLVRLCLARELSDREVHAAWLAERARHGWTHGERFDPAARTDPLMVPFDQLPERQRTLRAVLPAVLRLCGEWLGL